MQQSKMAPITSIEQSNWHHIKRIWLSEPDSDSESTASFSPTTVISVQLSWLLQSIDITVILRIPSGSHYDE